MSKDVGGRSRSKVTYSSSVEVVDATSQDGTVSQTDGDVARCRQKHRHEVDITALDDVITH